MSRALERMAKKIMPAQFVGLRQLEQLCGGAIKHSTWREHLREGRLSYHKIGHKLLVPMSEFERIMAENFYAKEQVAKTPQAMRRRNRPHVATGRPKGHPPGVPIAMQRYLIVGLSLTCRAYNVLKHFDIKSIEELIRHTAAELRRAPYCGKETLRDIEEQLAKVGLKLKAEEE